MIKSLKHDTRHKIELKIPIWSSFVFMVTRDKMLMSHLKTGCK